MSKKRFSDQTIVVVSSDEARTWLSMQEIIPAIERCWRLWARHEGVRVKLLADGSVGSAVRGILKMERPLAVVFTGMSSRAAGVIRTLREGLGFDVPFIVHTSGDAAAGGVAFEPVARCFRESDLFVVACEADAKALRLCFPKAQLAVSPFALLPKAGSKSRSRSSNADRETRFVYVGRVSEQKNLHTLIFAIALLDRLHPERVFTLDVYGAPDRVGSRNMGRKPIPYLRYLKKLAKSLGLSRRVRFHGLVARAHLKRLLFSRKHVFVSASLHSDENFGAAALFSLATGNRAVLSAWGGHRDLAHHLNGSCRLVPVHASAVGPFISPLEFARALEKELINSPKSARVPKASGLQYYCERTIAFQLGSFVRLVSCAKKRGGLRSSALFDALMTRRKRLQLKKHHVFLGYDDKLAQPFFKAYGQLNPRSARRKEFIIVPWLTASHGRAMVRDPHRGDFQGPLNARWLAARGFAFPVLPELNFPNAGKLAPHFGPLGTHSVPERRARRAESLRRRKTRN